MKNYKISSDGLLPLRCRTRPQIHFAHRRLRPATHRCHCPEASPHLSLIHTTHYKHRDFLEREERRILLGGVNLIV